MIPKMILQKRERDRLERVAKERGYDSTGHMLEEMYTTQKLPVETIARMLFTPIKSVRRQLDALGVQVRTRGGPNNVKIVITEDLYNEVLRDGAVLVAERIGVDPYILAARIKDWHLKHKGPI